MSHVSIKRSESVEINHLPKLGFDLDGLKFELLNMQDSRFPLDLLPAALVLMNDEEDLSRGRRMEIVAAFLEYFRSQHPRVWRKLRSLEDSTAYILGLLEAWVEASLVDPKASPSA